MRTYLGLKARAAEWSADAGIQQRARGREGSRARRRDGGGLLAREGGRVARPAVRHRCARARARRATSDSTSCRSSSSWACDERRFGQPGDPALQPQPGAAPDRGQRPALARDAGARDRAQQEHRVEPRGRADRPRAPARRSAGRAAGHSRATAAERRAASRAVRSCSGLEINVDYLAVWATDLAGVVAHRSFVANDNRAGKPEDAIGYAGAAGRCRRSHSRSPRAARRMLGRPSPCRGWSTPPGRWRLHPTWAGPTSRWPLC